MSSKKPRRRRAVRKMTVAERRRKDAERKTREYCRDPVKARKKNLAKRRSRLEHYKARARARYWKRLRKNRALARAYAHTDRGRANNLLAVKRYRRRHPHVFAAY